MISDYYTDQVTVYRLAESNDAGVIERRFTETAIVFTGRLRQLTGREIMENEKMTYKSTHRLYCDTGLDVRETDRVKIDGKFYEVTNVKSYPGRHAEISLEYSREFTVADTVVMQV